MHPLSPATIHLPSGIGIPPRRVRRPSIPRRRGSSVIVGGLQERAARQRVLLDSVVYRHPPSSTSMSSQAFKSTRLQSALLDVQRRFQESITEPLIWEDRLIDVIRRRRLGWENRQTRPMEPGSTADRGVGEGMVDTWSSLRGSEEGEEVGKRRELPPASSIRPKPYRTA